MTDTLILFAISALLAGFTVRFAISLALAHGILDRPGQHKQHETHTPFVGGTGILVALSIALVFLASHFPEHALKWSGLGLGAMIIFITGFIDDIFQLSYKLRFIVQTIVVLIMTLVSGVVISDLGYLLASELFALAMFAIPFTLLATIGGINALNMIDGIDGLSGSVTLMSLVLLGIVAYIAGDQPNLVLIIAVSGGTVAFLCFNLRHPFQTRAKVFLGDNGSMLLGFLIAWLLIDLSQGIDRAMTPVTALWLFSIPLMDTISIMLRRIRQQKSPFEPDHNHLHHIMLSAGYRVGDAVYTIAFIHLLLGGIGLAGLYLDIPEILMLLAFVCIFGGYFYLTLRPWHFITALRYLHALWGLAPTKSYGLFLGSHTAQEAENLVRMLSGELRHNENSLVHVMEQQAPQETKLTQYAVVVNIRLLGGDGTPHKETEQFTATLQARMKEQYGIQLRPFVERRKQDTRNIPHPGAVAENGRITERRRGEHQLLIFEAMFDQPASRQDGDKPSETASGNSPIK